MPDAHAIEAILDRIRTSRNFDFRNYKRATLRRRIERRVGVFGTDLDAGAVATARRGTYPPTRLEGLPAATLEKWFQPNGGGHTVRQELRRLVVFGVNNLVSDAPISRLDLILCRNVFIYHDA